VRMRDAIIDRDDGDIDCGPLSVALITGRPISVVERVFGCFGSDGVATPPQLVDLVLAAFGYRLSSGYEAPLDEPPPPLWRLLRFCPADAPLLIAIEDESIPHWIVTHGWFIADARTHGKWIEWSDHGLHADAPVASVWVVEGGDLPAAPDVNHEAVVAARHG
jgi:hypothetical protein